MNTRAIQLMEKGNAKKQRVIVKRTVVTKRVGRGKRFSLCSGPCTIFRFACWICVILIPILLFLVIAALSYKDPKVSYNDFEFTAFEVKTLLLPYGLKIGWDCHLAIDNTENGFHMATKPTKVYLTYGSSDDAKDQTILDVVDLPGMELKAGTSVIETISHTKEWNISDLPSIVTMAVEWLAGKDITYYINTDLDVKVLFIEKKGTIKCNVVVKGLSLSLKQKMECDVQYF